MIQVKRYQPEQGHQWDDFVRSSKNGLFLFERAYMDYHADRFNDHSLCFLRDDNLVALLPANQDGQVISSHGGLTFGGMICNHRMKTSWMLEIFESLLEYLHSHEIETLTYKTIPHIYHRMPAEEDLYALFRNNASLVGRNIASVICFDDKPSYSKGRKWSVKKSQSQGLSVKSGREYLNEFIAIELQLLQDKYQSAPVHSFNEMDFLMERFPSNIRLHTVWREKSMVGGTLVYVYGETVRTQYIGSTPEGRDLCAIDYLFDELLNGTYGTRKYFDFGTSNLEDGKFLEQSLVQNKESYGGRGIVYDTYQINLG